MGTVILGKTRWGHWLLRLTLFSSLGTLACVLSGCPGGAELEDPDRFPGLFVEPPGSGGSAGNGGGASGTGGLAIDCDYAVVLTDNCARGGCHNKRTPQAGLDLTVDAGLFARLKDVRTTHLAIDCAAPGESFIPCVPPEPPACVPFADALLVNSQDPEASWMLAKVNGSFAGCGDPMPLSPGDRPSSTDRSLDFAGARQECFERFVRALAALPPL